MKQIDSKLTVFGVMAAAILFTGIQGTSYGAPLPGGSLNPLKIPKYVRPLTILPSMPKSANPQGFTGDYYEIAVRQFQQEVVPNLSTTVWGYGSITNNRSFSYPAYTIEATANKPVRVKWINDLKQVNGKFLPHLLHVDQTLHWANPASADTMGEDPTRYTGPVPMVPHLHGAHVTQDSDGYPEAWFLPNATNIPVNFSKVGTKYEQFKNEAQTAYGQTWEPGTSVYQYPNDQRASALWYHDHSLGMTRVNVYAGPAGFYFIRGGSSDLTSGLPKGAYEIPLLIQDRSFNKDGSLFYPDNRAFFEGLAKSKLKIPFTPDTTIDGEQSTVAPAWNPEFFGNTMVVNGKTWPYLNVEKRRYRFRILNASDTRFLILKMSNSQKFWVIGNDGGFLPTPAKVDTLLVAPAERFDVIVDFSNAPLNSKITLQNIGPDSPFGGGSPGVDFDSADPDTTGQVMQFRVVAGKGTDNSQHPANVQLPAIAPITGTPVVRHLSLNEMESSTVYIPVDATGAPVLNNLGELVAVSRNDASAAPFGPETAELGSMDANGTPVPSLWMDPITTQPTIGQTEEWVLYNYTEDAHPIHLHQVQFEVIERIDAAGVKTPAQPWETGLKDTIIAYPGDGVTPGITRVKAKFDIIGLFAWHCHILSHEDNEMMLPIQTVSP